MLNTFLAETLFGELYQVRNNKKVYLNKQNVQRYEEYQEMLDDLDKFSFLQMQTLSGVRQIIYC